MKQTSTESCSRRDFLRQSVGAGVATAAGSGCAALTSGGGNWIDAHVHVWTPDTEKYPLASGFTKAGMSPPSFTPEQLFAHCQPEGVTRIVLIQMSYYRNDNRYMLDMMQAHPGVFSGVAIIDEHAADVRGRMKALKAAGVRGFRINPGAQPVDAWLGSAGMKEMWKVAADEGLNMCALINPEALEAIDKMAVQFPETGLVIDHFARLGMAGPILRGPLDRLLHLSKHPRAHVKTSAFYALGAKKAPYLDMGPMIKELRDSFGAERLMWASDCPFQVDPGHSYHDSIALVRDRLEFLTAQEKEWILRRTAERVFFT